MRILSNLSVLRLCGSDRLKLALVSRTMSTEVVDGLRLSQVVQFLTSFAPLSLAESWDNVGLLVEPSTPVPIKKVLLTIDLTESVMKEAVEAKANMIIAYHPPIFQPFKRITSGQWKERLVSTCLEEKIAVYSPHTSWDAVEGGLSDWLASPFDFETSAPLTPSKAVLPKKDFSHQLTVFCPLEFNDKCSHAFNQNKAEILSSTQLNTTVKYSVIAERRFLPELESALNETQSYYSIYERSPVPPKGCGTGRFGKLKAPIQLSEAINKLKDLVAMPQIRIALQDGKSLDSMINSVAVVAGSGASVLRGVRADLFVTGEMLHHDLLDANHCGTSVALINHSDSERGYLSQFAPIMANHFANKLTVLIAKTDKDPIMIV